MASKAEKEKAVEHIGTKTLGLVLGFIGWFLWTIFSIFYAFLPTLSLTTIVPLYMIANYFLISVLIVIGGPAVLFLAQVLWKYMHGISEQVG